MIRNMVMIQLTPEADPAKVAEIQEGFRSLECPGTVSYTLGDDLGLKDGGWSFGIVSDHVDEDAYRGYDLDAEHNRLRGELAPFIGQVARVQFALPDA